MRTCGYAGRQQAHDRESLILCGAFDSLENCRAPLISNLEKIMKVAKFAKSARDRGQLPLFPIDWHLFFTDTAEYDPIARLAMEKALLGFYVSGHPLAEYRQIVENYTTVDTETLTEYPYESEICVAGIITRYRNLMTKKGIQWHCF